jgi:hypothetical protein
MVKINKDTVTALTWLNSYGTPIALLIILQMLLIVAVWFCRPRKKDIFKAIIFNLVAVKDLVQSYYGVFGLAFG